MSERQTSERQSTVTPERRQLRHDSRAMTTWRAFQHDLMDEGGFDSSFAEQAAVCVLSHLEEQLTGEEVRDLEAQLPSVLRELLEAGPRHSGRPERRFGRDEYLSMIAEDLRLEPERAGEVAAVVIRTVRRHLTAGECDDVEAQLPRDLAALWRAEPTISPGPGPQLNSAMHQLL